MSYFMRRLNYVESEYTPELPGFLSCFLFLFKKNNSLSGYSYLNPSGVLISGYIDIEFCRKLDKMLNLLYQKGRNLRYTSICKKFIRDKDAVWPSYIFDFDSRQIFHIKVIFSA